MTVQGIGKEYALALAQSGLNIILVSRNKQELENTANEIRDKHKVDTVTLVADFTDIDNVSKVVKKVKSLNHEIGVLVNNAGMMGPGYVNITDMEKKSIKVRISFQSCDKSGPGPFCPAIMSLSQIDVTSA